ncbi:MAG: hypothetical protein GEU83_00305 [Pseudonocardiaceae bacterium]|nr:hypothetical protein [Pseudonocardiaceae bacterium]
MGWLLTLFGAYLHQDWKEIYGDAWTAVSDFRSVEPADYVARAADQVRRILEADHDEAQLDAITGKLGSYYYPPGSGWTYRGWLTELEKLLRSAA